jgi:hypothetical protein
VQDGVCGDSLQATAAAAATRKARPNRDATDNLWGGTGAHHRPNLRGDKATKQLERAIADANSQ